MGSRTMQPTCSGGWPVVGWVVWSEFTCRIYWSELTRLIPVVKKKYVRLKNSFYFLFATCAALITQVPSSFYGPAPRETLDNNYGETHIVQQPRFA